MPRRTVAVAAVLLGMLMAAQPQDAMAGLAGRGTGTEATSSGSFAVIPTTLATTPPPGPLVLTYAAVALPAAQYFDAVNTGSVDLVAASYAVAVSGGGATGNPSVTLTACTGGSWNVISGACSGTPVTIGTWTSASSAAVSSTAVPAAPAARLGIKASVTGGGLLTAITIATVSISVSSGPTRQIRAAATTTS